MGTNHHKYAKMAVCLWMAPITCMGEPQPDGAELPRIPGRSLEEAQKSFQVREGFRVELAAG